MRLTGLERVDLLGLRALGPAAGRALAFLHRPVAASLVPGMPAGSVPGWPAGSRPADGAYGKDMSHWCRSPASVACCSGSIMPVVLSAPNTGLRHPQVQAACTPPSPTSWIVVWWSTAIGALTGGQPGSSSPAARRRSPHPGEHQPAQL